MSISKEPFLLTVITLHSGQITRFPFKVWRLYDREYSPDEQDVFKSLIGLGIPENVQNSRRAEDQPRLER